MERVSVKGRKSFELNKAEEDFDVQYGKGKPSPRKNPKIPKLLLAHLNLEGIKDLFPGRVIDFDLPGNPSSGRSKVYVITFVEEKLYLIAQASLQDAKLRVIRRAYNGQNSNPLGVDLSDSVSEIELLGIETHGGKTHYDTGAGLCKALDVRGLIPINKVSSRFLERELEKSLRISKSSLLHSEQPVQVEAVIPRMEQTIISAALGLKTADHTLINTTPLDKYDDRIRKQNDPLLSPPASNSEAEDLDLLDSVGAENKKVLVSHLLRERSSVLRNKKIRAMMKKESCLKCEACNFDFELAYGSLGKGFAEVHHIKPLSTLGETETKLSDLAVLCSNCHRMIHRTNPIEDLTTFRARIQAIRVEGA